MQKKFKYDQCAAAPIAEWLANKWVPVLLLALRDGTPQRFNTLYRATPALSEKMLAQTLRMLAQDGLIEKIIYVELPPHTEYRLTELGRSLIPHLEALRQWGRDHLAEICAHRAKHNTIN